jgi:hypothetical protein
VHFNGLHGLRAEMRILQIVTLVAAIQDMSGIVLAVVIRKLSRFVQLYFDVHADTTGRDALYRSETG